MHSLSHSFNIHSLLVVVTLVGVNRDSRPSIVEKSIVSIGNHAVSRRCDMRSRLHASLHKRISDKNLSGLHHVPKIHVTATSVPLLHIGCSVMCLAFTYRSEGEKRQRCLSWSETRAPNRRRDEMDRDHYTTDAFRPQLTQFWSRIHLM